METIKRIFLSPEEPRLRSGFRLAIQIGLWLALTVLLALPVVILWNRYPKYFDVVNVAVNALTIIPSVWLARRYLDRRSVRSLGLAINRRAGLDLLVGIGIAVVQIAVIYLIEVQAGWLKFEGFGWEGGRWSELFIGLLWWGLLFAAVGFYEELLSRGYHLQNLEEGTNLFWAVLLSSGFFGLMHLANPGATWVSSLLIAVSGVILAFGYLRTRALWLPIGMHFGWNFFEGPVFGFPVSGMGMAGILEHRVSGPGVWTGGGFGPEAGLVVLPGLLAGAALVYAFTRRRGSGQEAGDG